MTPEDVDKMPAGREFDKLIAEQIMRDDNAPWHEILTCGYPDCAYCLCNCLDYSTDIAAAWQVVEKMKQIGFGFWIAGDECWFQTAFQAIMRTPVVSASMPLAICRAALKAHLAAQEPQQPEGAGK